MYPDGLMMVQGTAVATAESWHRRLRGGAFATVGVLIGICALTPHVLTSAPADQAPTPPPVYGGESAIIQLCREGRASEAVTVADHYIRRASSFPAIEANLFFLKGGALRLLGRDDEMIAAYTQASDLAGTCHLTDFQMDTAAQARNYAAAEELARETIRENGDPVQMNNACWDLTMYPDGDPAFASRIMKNVVPSYNTSSLLDTYAWSLYLSGNKDQAIAAERRALDMVNGEGFERVSYYQACLKGMQGDRSDAETALREMFQQNITFTSAWVAADRFATRQ